MEFTLLQKSDQSKRFAHFRVQGRETRKSNIEGSNSGFYYIGSDSTAIEKLVRMFKRGYASEGIENAKAELTRCLAKDVNSIPEVIFCDSHFSTKELQSLSLFLSTHPLLFVTPLILDGSNLSDKDLSLHKKAKLVDEIILLQDADDQLLNAKCRFLRKVKSRGADMTVENGLKENVARVINFPYLIKRLFDIAISGMALIILSPVFMLIALAIRLESRGSVFYISKRAGMGYRIFDFYKFRTMHMDADKSMDEFTHLNQYAVSGKPGPLFFKIDNDPRVTRIGSFLRNTSIDELPQLINVLIGDMSLVGNRPLPLYEAATLTTDDCAKRFMAPAGITGLWQIKKRGKQNMSVEERISLDIDYANKSNFMYDLWIIANTPSALIQKANA